MNTIDAIAIKNQMVESIIRKRSAVETPIMLIANTIAFTMYPRMQRGLNRTGRLMVSS